MTDSPLFSFEKLRVYQLSKMMVGNIYQALHQFPKEETFALSSQLRRAAISIPSNIAEKSLMVKVEAEDNPSLNSKR